MMSTILDFPEIQSLLPHRDDMALLSRVLRFAPPQMQAQAVIEADSLLADAQGNMPAWIGIELMAQTAAAYIGLLARQEGRPPPEVGYLLGTRKYTAQVDVFEKNSALTIVTEMIYRDDSGLAAFDCKIFLNAVNPADAESALPIASATINVFEPPLAAPQSVGVKATESSRK